MHLHAPPSMTGSLSPFTGATLAAGLADKQHPPGVLRVFGGDGRYCDAVLVEFFGPLISRVS